MVRRKLPQVRKRASAAFLLLPVLALSLTGCVRIGAPTANQDAADDVEAAQLKIEDQAWALRSIFFRPDFGPEWREIRDAQGKPTVGLPFADCLAAASGAEIDPASISANAGSPRFTRANGAFAASNALVTTSPDQARVAVRGRDQARVHDVHREEHDRLPGEPAGVSRRAPKH